MGGFPWWELCMGHGENVEAILGCKVGGCCFFLLCTLGSVLFCDLFELLFFLPFDAVVFTLIEHVSRVEGAVVEVVFAQVGCLHHREVLDVEWGVFV